VGDERNCGPEEKTAEKGDSKTKRRYAKDKLHRRDHPDVTEKETGPIKSDIISETNRSNDGNKVVTSGMEEKERKKKC